MSAMSKTTVYAIQHVAVEPPGLISEMLKARGIGIEPIRPFKGDRVPRRMGSRAGLVVMGGPMGVDEQKQYPFLQAEFHLIQDALKEEKPILGVCLGSQLLAAALGVPVTRGKQKEIGWHPVTLGRVAAHDVLWHGLPESFVAYHWHGDVFELPRAATPLAWSKLTDCQAFRHGDLAYGFLFHLEVTERIIQRMTRTFRRELREAGLNERHTLHGVAEYLPGLHTIGRAVFGRWAALVNGETDAQPDKLTIRIKRVYEPSAPNDGARFLVNRLWPRGVKKASLRLDGWFKEVAPTDGLRRWFHHDPARWPEFRRRYFAELDQRAPALRPILAAARRGQVTLLFAARDAEFNHAAALRNYLLADQTVLERKTVGASRGQ